MCVAAANYLCAPGQEVLCTFFWQKVHWSWRTIFHRKFLHLCMTVEYAGVGWYYVERHAVHLCAFLLLFAANPQYYYPDILSAAQQQLTKIMQPGTMLAPRIVPAASAVTTEPVCFLIVYLYCFLIRSLFLLFFSPILQWCLCGPGWDCLLWVLRPY